jgi:hypothetical protein
MTLKYKYACFAALSEKNDEACVPWDQPEEFALSLCYSGASGDRGSGGVGRSDCPPCPRAVVASRLGPALGSIWAKFHFKFCND